MGWAWGHTGDTWALSSIQRGHSWPLGPEVLWASARAELGRAADQGPGWKVAWAAGREPGAGGPRVAVLLSWVAGQKLCQEVERAGHRLPLHLAEDESASLCAQLSGPHSKGSHVGSASRPPAPPHGPGTGAWGPGALWWG